MGDSSIKCASALVMALLLFQLGCAKTPEEDRGAASITVHAFAIRDIQLMTVTVTGSNLGKPVSIPLVQQGNQFSALLTHIPVGTDYAFTASAKDAAAVELYHGVVANRAILKNKTADIVINMNQVAPAVPYVNKAPVVDAITTSATVVSYGGTVQISAQAKDPDAGQTALLAFAWTATCGSLSNAATISGSDATDATSSTVFTAPTVDASCVVQLAVTDPPGMKNVASFTITVSAKGTQGGGKITAIPNTLPVIAGLMADPIPLQKGQPSTLTVNATDPDGDALSFVWTSSCAGVFGAATSATTTFLLDSASTANSCEFQVVVRDGTWSDGTPKGAITNTLTLPVGAALVQTAPVFGIVYQSLDTITGGDAVVFAVNASDPAGGAIRYNWTTSSGPAAVPTPPATLGPDLGAFAAAALWSAPTGAESGPVVKVTATATSLVSGLSTNFVMTLVPRSSFCVGRSDGTDCTVAAFDANRCVTAASCQVGVCIPTRSLVCPGTTCTPATGQCNAQPVVVSMDASPIPIVQGTATTMIVVATDDEGDLLSYQWTSNCGGTFGAATSATSSFSLAAGSTATSCDFSVVVYDGAHGADGVTSGLTLPVGTVRAQVAPQIGVVFQSNDTIAGGDLIEMAVQATDPEGGTLSYTWSTSSGTPPSVVSPASLRLDTATFTSAATWLAPAGAENGPTITIVVTATSSASGLSTRYTITLIPASTVP
jgi:hypothetical protein